MSILPNSWNAVPCSEIASINPSKGIISVENGQMAHFVPMANVAEEFGGIDVSTVRPMREMIKGYTAFRGGDVLFAKITPCMENGKIAVVPALEHRIGFGSTEFHVIRPFAEITSKWLAHYFSRVDVRRRAQRCMTGSAGQIRVPSAWIADELVPIAPINEQRRIIEKIEELFSDLDAGAAGLERIRTKLKRYRAAVLKAAVEGNLSTHWRARHSNVEPAADLLQRILAERRRKWEENQLAKYAGAGKEPPKGWRERYQEPVAPDSVDLPIIPKAWTVASLDQLTTTITSGSRDWSQYYGSGTGTFIMAQNVRPGRLDLSWRQAVDPPLKDRDRERSQVVAGDLLVTIVGANTGDVCRVPEDLPEHYVCQSVALMRPVNAAYSRLLELNLISPDNGQRQFKRYVYGQGRPHLGFDQLRTTPILIPPEFEQQEIVQQAEQRLSLLDLTHEMINTNVKRVARLRQSILKRAFEGKLVPQVVTDEPASALLERIRRQREQAAKRPAGANGRGRPGSGKTPGRASSAVGPSSPTS
jgi:type I restriction enzyme S subunit